MASIKLAGVITPPVLFPRNRSWVIISGFKRIGALKQLGMEETLACTLGRETSPERIIELAVVENAVQRKLNPVEQGRAILLLDTLYSEDGALCEAANALGISVNSRVAAKLRLAAQMKPALRTALVNGDLALPVALKLAKMKDHATADRLAMIIGAMGLGLNRQRELLDWLNGISRREGCSLNALLDEDQVKQLLGDPDLERKQKSKLLRHHFKLRRYPEITETEARFYKIVKSLKLDTGIQLVPPPHFEGQTYSLKINFNNQQDLISKYKSLEKAVTSDEMASLWDLFRIR